MQPVYNVPVIPQNLRKEETIVHIAESLNYLSEVSDDIIKKINDRIEVNNNNLSKLLTRIQTVSSKITNLAGAKKAIQVFSSSQYPATDINRQYVSVFKDDDCPKLSRYAVNYKDLPIKDEPLETLQFYHVKVSNVSISKCEGLGDIPKDVEAVNDLLLYNSGKNPYNKYVMSDTLQMLQTSKREDVVEGPEIGAAPFSISERTALTKTAGDNYFYTPNLGDVPAIDVPLDLPDLPGIADDLRYINEAGPGIAPSATTTPNVPDLPEIITSNEPNVIQIANNFISLPNVPDTSTVQHEQTITIDNEKVTKDATETKKEVAVNESKSETFEIRTKKIIADVSDVHANLMEAIRKAGGSQNAKLRSAEPNNKIGKPSLSGGDLMADLHAKLTLRRKGISGAKNPDGTEAGSAMDRISAMIPPPPAKNEQAEAATTDEDWDD